VEPLPDLGTLSDDDLKQLIDDLTQEEQEISYRRRLLQTEGRSVLDQLDVDRLTEILTSKSAPPA
jgi:hypothetical protein